MVFTGGPGSAANLKGQQLPAAADQRQEGALETLQVQVTMGKTQDLLCSLWESCLGTFGHMWPEFWSLTGWCIHDRDKTQNPGKAHKASPFIIVGQLASIIYFLRILVLIPVTKTQEKTK